LHNIKPEKITWLCYWHSWLVTHQSGGTFRSDYQSRIINNFLYQNWGCHS